MLSLYSEQSRAVMASCFVWRYPGMTSHRRSAHRVSATVDTRSKWRKSTQDRREQSTESQRVRLCHREGATVQRCVNETAIYRPRKIYIDHLQLTISLLLRAIRARVFPLHRIMNRFSVMKSTVISSEPRTDSTRAPSFLTAGTRL